MSKKRKLDTFLDKNKLNSYLKENHKDIDKYLSYDLQNMIFKRIIKIKKLQIKSHKLWLEENELIECENCGRVWDGFAQCDCILHY